jgi:hypothetical protein
VIIVKIYGQATIVAPLELKKDMCNAWQNVVDKTIKLVLLADPEYLKCPF